MTTVYDVLHTLAKYDGAPGAHSMVIADCRKYAGKSASMSAAWCSETVGAALAVAGDLFVAPRFEHALKYGITGA